ncbi:hypothetical protein ACE6H2_019902 [Prunus campanulata]
MTKIVFTKHLLAYKTEAHVQVIADYNPLKELTEKQFGIERDAQLKSSAQIQIQASNLLLTASETSTGHLFSQLAPQILHANLAFALSGFLVITVMIVVNYRQLKSQSSSPALGFPRLRFFRYRRLR